MDGERGQRVIRCDCGFEAASEVDDELVALAQAHSRTVHGTEVPAALLLALARTRTSTQDSTTEG